MEEIPYLQNKLTWKTLSNIWRENSVDTATWCVSLLSAQSLRKILLNNMKKPLVATKNKLNRLANLEPRTILLKKNYKNCNWIMTICWRKMSLKKHWLVRWKWLSSILWFRIKIIMKWCMKVTLKTMVISFRKTGKDIWKEWKRDRRMRNG